MALGDDIYTWYQQYLGRNPDPSEVDNWLNGTYGATDPAGIQSQIQQSGEASAYRQNTGQTAPAASPAPAPSGGGGGGSPAPAPATTTPSPSAAPGGSGTAATFGPWTGTFTPPTPQGLPDQPVWQGVPDAPTFTAPVYTKPDPFSFTAAAPSYQTPAAFSYADFQAPTAAEALNDPGYQFRLQQGTDALQNAASAKGTLNDSGTLKALLDYGQGAASQEYQNVWQRDLGAYTTNRGNAADTYKTNVQTQVTDPYNAAVDAWKTNYSNALGTYTTNYATQYKDPYDIAYKSAVDQFAPVLAHYNAQAANVLGQNQAAVSEWGTTASHIDAANALANTNAWNPYQLAWQDFEARRNLGANFALSS